MARQWSLAGRLAWRLAGVMVIAMAVAAGAVAWRSVATIRSLDDTALQSQARLVAGQVSPGPDGRPVLNMPGQLADLFRASDGESLFVVYDRAGEPVAASDPTAAATIAAFLPAHHAPGYFRVPASPNFPNGLLGIVTNIDAFQVVVAQAHEQSEAMVDSLLHDFALSIAWLLIPITALTVLIGVLTIRHGLRPLRNAAEAAGKVGPAHLGMRLPETGLPGEIRPLVIAINQGVTRLEQALAGQRRFIGAAAHGLRTPLAVLTARIDALGPSGEATALREDVDRITRLVGQMLTMARLEELPLDVSVPVSLHAAAVEAISALAPLAIRHQVELELSEPTSLPPVKGNHAAIVLALTNLLDNALAVAPAGSAIEVVTTAPATISVLDRGPGVTESDRTKIFERFGRGQGARAGGSGLGLAIVCEIAVAHGGTISVALRPGGGAVFSLRLAAPASAR